METTAASARSFAGLSYAILLFAAVLAVAAAWLLVPMAARWLAAPACRAATLAVVRGDLWDACAEGSAVSSGASEGRAALEETVSWAPSRTKAWLRLAAGEDEPAAVARGAEALRMSFYTGPNEVDVIPMRLSVSLRPGMLPDTDMERLVRHDLLTILTHAPHLRPALIAAYREASPEGRRFLAAAVEEIDPGFAPDLRSGGLPAAGNKE